MEKKDLPNFVGSKLCGKCKERIPVEEYSEIGFFCKGEDNGRLFIRYTCPHCNKNGILNFGGGDYNLENLCKLIIKQSLFLSEGEKSYWLERIEEMEKNKNK